MTLATGWASPWPTQNAGGCCDDPSGMEASLDLSEAEWVRESLTTFAKDVASIVPAVFAEYARIFHPLQGGVRWGEVANANGRVLHAEAQFQGVATPVGAPLPMHQWDVRGPWACPRTGTMPSDVRDHLAHVLAEFTITPDRISFGLWDGYGYLHPSRGSGRALTRSGAVIARWKHPDPHPHPEWFEARPRRPTLELPNRSYLMYNGALSDVSSWPWDGPNLWWPHDRAWFVASEIDFVSTYVGGTAEAIAAILAATELEALPARISDSINSDEVNV